MRLSSYVDRMLIGAEQFYHHGVDIERRVAAYFAPRLMQEF